MEVVLDEVVKSKEDTEKQTFQAMEGFIHNLNTMHSRAGAQVPFTSINFGTDTTEAGRLVSKNLLEATMAGLGRSETPIFPISIFKVKEGVNYNPGDPNYDLFKRSMEVSAKRLFPNFCFIDAPFNLQYYKPGDYRTEIATMGCRTRVFSSVFPESDGIVTGRGNTSWTTINLVRIGIKHGICLGERKEADWSGFYKELDEKMELVRDQLLERFEIQAKKKVHNYPFLMGQGVWIDSEKLDEKAIDEISKQYTDEYSMRLDIKKAYKVTVVFTTQAIDANDTYTEPMELITVKAGGSWYIFGDVIDELNLRVVNNDN